MLTKICCGLECWAPQPGLETLGIFESGVHCQPPQDLFVRAGKGQLLQPAEAKPAAFVSAGTLAAWHL